MSSLPCVGHGAQLFHPESTNPRRAPFRDPRKPIPISQLSYPLDIPREYNRGLQQYEEELFGQFNIKDWRGKKILDIGAGALLLFARQARLDGVEVTSVNPALKFDKHRAFLEIALGEEDLSAKDQAYQAYHSWPRWKKFILGYPKIKTPEYQVAEATAQDLPFRDESFDCAVSVFGVPHYLHHVDPMIASDQDVLSAYTNEVRDADKTLIKATFREILRVTKPGGKVFTADSHSKPGQLTNINRFSPSDGTEVVEVVDELAKEGILHTIINHEYDDGVHRVITLTKPSS